MIFVPLSLFVPIGLVVVLLGILFVRDITQRSTQLFAAVVALYALQSLLLTLRWGYGLPGLGPVIAALAPVLPILAFAAHASLAGRIGRMGWMLGGALAVNWLSLVILPEAADALIPLTYLVIGVFLLLRGLRGGEWVAAVRVAQMRQARRAMAVTGAVLIGSALTDVYVLYDFIANDGKNVQGIVGGAQIVFLLLIGLAAVPAGAGVVADMPSEPSDTGQPNAVADDHAIVERLQSMFAETALHTDPDINLRRLSRRLGLPDRRVSQAINRVTGASVSQFVNEHRVATACMLLTDTDDSVLQVSLQAGFLTKSNFNTAFLRITGQTPTAWRKAQQ